MLRNVVSYIGSDWSNEDCCCKLSKKALEYILSKSERDCGTAENELSVEEYFTFRKIVLWHVHQTMKTGAVEPKATLQKILPGEGPSSLWQQISKVPADIDNLLLSVSTSVESFDSSATLNYMLGTNVDKYSLVQLLTHVRLRLIPAPLLLKAVYPLKIFPPQQLLEAVVHIAMHRRALATFDWKHGPACKIGRDKEITCNDESGEGRGMGVAVIPWLSSRFGDKLEWNFRILEHDAKFIELGFICEPTGGLDKKLEENLWRRSSARVLCIDRANAKTCVSRTFPVKFWDSWECFKTQVGINSIVKFQLDVLERTCRVSFGDSFEAEWADLPNGEYHPAVGFCQSKRATIELKLSSGFNSF